MIGSDASAASSTLVSTTTRSDLFADLAAGVRTLLSERATFNVDRKAGLLQVTTGYDVLAAVAAVDDFWSHAPGTEQLVWWVWIFGDLIAFAVILGFPLAAALVARLATVVRERAWGSFEAATAAAILIAACWGHTRGEVERMWQFLVPFAVVAATRQLLRWRAGLPLVAGLLLGQALAIQLLFYTRW